MDYRELKRVYDEYVEKLEDLNYEWGSDPETYVSFIDEPGVYSLLWRGLVLFNTEGNEREWDDIRDEYMRTPREEVIFNIDSLIDGLLGVKGVLERISQDGR